jgi:predicted SAM-dependent methyltransferase
MSIVKENLKKRIITRPRELLDFVIRQYEQVKRNERIDKKNKQKIEVLLKSSSPIKLELGAGANRGISGWTYVDLNENCELTLDLRQPLPFPNDSVDVIYSCHFLEHFGYYDLLNILNECLRILKPGAIFSAAVPNARIYLEAYQNPVGFDPDMFCRYKPAYNYNSKIDFVNYMAYMDGHHHYMFDEENLITILKKTGFKTVIQREFDKDLDMEVRNFQTIYVQCEK